ncbi:MAG: hypothetical protein AAF901_08675 [Bacteroidota bacterium]
MKTLHLHILILLLFTISSLSAQGNYGIIFPNTETERDRNCKTCYAAFRQKPKEVKFSIERDKNNLFFITNDKTWFNSLFKGSTDGLAIDVVKKKRFSCDLEAIEDTQINGKLLRPLYASRLKSGLKTTGENQYRVLVGRVPEALEDEELEYNILFLNNKVLCRYQVIYHLESYPWDILDMGLYLDSIRFKAARIKTQEKEGFRVKYKTLKFIIPFEKNKSEYSPEDIKPLYDSLNLTNFNIKTIDIKAYASIEGSLERNIELQEQRAKSIADALQSYQSPTIETQISSSENWVEFLNDISGTPYETLKTLSKQELKRKLVGAFSKEMEPILKKHRKAVVTLELEKKDKYKTMSSDELVQLFNTSIKEEQLDEAQIIQNSIFEKLRNKVNSPDILKKMEIPNQLKYINFLNNNSAITYELDERLIIIVRDELEALKKLDPKNPRIRYNLTAIKFRLWRYNFEPVNADKFKSEIYGLKNYGIAKVLIDRMMINYHIIRSENFMRKRDFANKDKSVAYINKAYKNIPLSDVDFFSLAQFLAYYDNVDSAAQLLTEKARSIDVDEDLLFYYLNLTLINEELTKTDDYRVIMLNASNLNIERYCKIFNAIEEGGVTFQLLRDDYLRASYCENCEN